MKTISEQIEKYDEEAREKFKELPFVDSIYCPSGSQYDISSAEGCNYVEELNDIFDDADMEYDLNSGMDYDYDLYFGGSLKEKNFVEKVVNLYIKEQKDELLERLTELQKETLDGVMYNLENYVFPINDESVLDNLECFYPDFNFDKVDDRDSNEYKLYKEQFNSDLEFLKETTEEVLEKIFKEDAKKLEKMNIKVNALNDDYDIIWKNHKG